MPEVAVFGGGCFWCIEAAFKQLKGVMGVISGYAGGTTVNPTYERISVGDTGHAEVVKVIYDSAHISYEDLLTVFFAMHDATSLNKQGSDIGTQYRSIILYTNDAQKAAAEAFIAKLDADLPRVAGKAGAASGKIVTEVKPLGDFYDAEDYHQDYYASNKDMPYCQIVINPKLELLKKKFDSLLAG
jgi:peptide-methionine (S)-S-oxide reductase